MVLGQHQLKIANVTFEKCALAEGQVVVPHSYEPIVKSQGLDFSDGVEEALAPCCQRAGVMGPHVLGMKYRELGRARERVKNSPQRGQLSAGEDVLLDPVALLHVLRESLFIHGDGLKQQGAVRFEQPVAGVEELVIVLETYGLEHLDAYDLVETAAQGTVILQQKLDAPVGICDDE